MKWVLSLLRAAFRSWEAGSIFYWPSIWFRECCQNKSWVQRCEEQVPDPLKLPQSLTPPSTEARLPFQLHAVPATARPAPPARRGPPFPHGLPAQHCRWVYWEHHRCNWEGNVQRNSPRPGHLCIVQMAHLTNQPSLARPVWQTGHHSPAKLDWAHISTGAVR